MRRHAILSSLIVFLSLLKIFRSLAESLNLDIEPRENNRVVRFSNTNFFSSEKL